MRGIWTALITPFNRKNELDLEAFRKLIHDQRDAGISGVIPCGTTGETPTLTVDEKKTLFKLAIDELKGSNTKVFAGTGSNNTRDSIELSRWASDAGAHGVLLITPYYNKPSQAGLEAHFRAVADAVSCEVMLYNVPGRTGVSMAAQTVVELADHPRIRSLKEATANPAFTSEVLDRLSVAGRSIDILSGDDATFLPLLSIGAVGVVSVSSNLFPRAMVKILRDFEAGKHQDALATHQKFYPLFRDLFIDSNPVPLKHAMAFAGFCEPVLRLPLVPLSAELTRTLDASLKRCGVAPGKKL